MNQLSIPGDAVIGDDSTTNLIATLHAITEQQINPLANVTIHKSGLLNLATSMGHFEVNQTLGTISGYGPITLGNPYVSVLYVSNNVPCEYFGSVSGNGAFTKYGTGTMTTWGDFNNTDEISIYGGDWRFNGTRHNGGIGVGSGGRLRGDGAVDQSLSLGATGHFAVDSRFPDHRGDTFRMGSLYADAGSVVELEMFGPSPTGGNDKVSTGTVGAGFSGVTLTTSFSYPPHDGDVITLINVTNGPAYSAFSNFPAGVVTLVGTVPVVPSYTGGSGHDFTLTVTNLALAYFGYRLAEGNGNQTVEPNECNLLYVSLLNRRLGPLTITNAFLRATNTIGVLVTIPVASFPTIPAGQAAECLTPFQFSRDTNLGCGASVGFELVVDAVNEGQFAINFSPVSGDDCTHPTGPCDSCTVASGIFTTNTPVMSQPLYFVGAPSLCFPPKAYPGTNPAPSLATAPYLTHTFTNSTTNLVCVIAELEFNCPAAPTNALGVAAYLSAFDPNNPATGYLGDIGQGGPPYPAFAFQVPAGSNFTLVVMAQATNLVCDNYTLQLFGFPCPPPTLALTNDAAPAAMRVQWSSAYPGFTAQQSSKLTGGTFTNITRSPVILNGRYSLTNLPATTSQFYRLKK